MNKENLKKLDKKLRGSEFKEHTVGGIELKGEDTGKYGRLIPIVIHPNMDMLKDKTEKEINDIMEKTLTNQLWKHCENIGWWPDENYKPYEINKQKDGSYLLTAFLKPGIKNAKLTHEDVGGTINIDDR